VAQHIPASGSLAQSAVPVQATVSSGAQDALHVVSWFTRSAQHVSPLGHATCGQAVPASVLPPLLLPLLVPELLPELPPLLPAPLLEFPPLLPLLLPPAPLLELPEPLPPEEPPPPPPSSEVAEVGALVPHAIQTSVLAITSAAPTETFREIRDFMGAPSGAERNPTTALLFASGGALAIRRSKPSV
jgi:hypothetical protein